MKTAPLPIFVVGVDLGQSADYTAISIVERIDPTTWPLGKRPEPTFNLRYLHRPPLGTRYPAIVEQVIGLLDRAPLTRATPLVVDKTGVGAAVVDMFTQAGVKPRAITITGGDQVNREDPFDLRVPKRELASTLVSLYQSHRLKTAAGLDLAPTLLNELISFKVKVNIATGNDSYESWRESIHDDLVLSVALACWWAAQYRPSYGPPVAWAGERSTIHMPDLGRKDRDPEIDWKHLDDRMPESLPWFERLGAVERND